jgi:peptidoglycan DL-endopeptidase CwlS
MRSRKLLLCFLPLLLALFVSTPARAETTNGGKVMVNSALMPNIQTASYNGTLLVPAKEFVESLGGSFTYDNKTMIGTARVGENELAFHLDDGVACFDGKYVQSPAPMKIINYRFMIPAEFTAVKLGAESHLSSFRNILMLFQPTDGKLVYSVMSGDTLWLISQLFGTTAASLRQLNGITGDVIYVGQKLVIRDFSAYNVSMPAYTTGGATLRSGAGFGYSIPGYLGKAVDISVTGKSGDWYKVTTTKGNGYLYSTVVGMKQEFRSEERRVGKEC